MHRKSRQLALAAIFASTLTAGATALLGGTASAATGAPGSAAPVSAWAPQASEPGGSVRAASYTTISEPLLATEAVPMAEMVPIGLPRITVAEFPAQWSASQYSGSSLRSEAFPGMGASMEQMAEEARQSIRDEASSARQQIMQEAASAQQRIEQMSQRAQQRLSEQAQSQSSSLPESAPGSALGSAPENVPPAIWGPESAPPAGIPPTSSESSSSESSSSEACQ